MCVTYPRFYQGPLIVDGLFVGVLFCNKHHIESIENELHNVSHLSSLVEEIIEDFLKNYFLGYNIWV